MAFKKYMHIERFGNDEVQGIELGNCWIFPKIDGTNASVWLEDGRVCAGSRNRQLTEEADNAGFWKFATDNVNIRYCLGKFPWIRLYGEWLVPHSLKTYRDDAWRKFYVFDVYDDDEGRYLHYDEYSPILRESWIDYIPAMAKFKNATYDGLLNELDKNTFLIQDGSGIGEGIVIKNYDYRNRFGELKFAKIVTTKFKEQHRRVMGPDEKKGPDLVEQKIIDECAGEHLINKVYAKIVNECGGWNSKYIPRLFSTVYHDLIREELWTVLKKLKNPAVNFSTLYQLLVLHVKQVRPELF